MARQATPRTRQTGWALVAVFGARLGQLQTKLAPQLWDLLSTAAAAATDRGWHLYLVGGAVRDLLLAETATGDLLIQDIDLVVDGCQQAAVVGAGVELAKVIQQLYPGCRLDIHGTFQTAALLWDGDSSFNCLGLDIATARTESYPYPAANPIVESSSIDRDLYRRDFTINAMALRLTPDLAPLLVDLSIDRDLGLRDLTIDAMSLQLTPDSTPPLLDLYGGLADLHAKQLRVLHSDSFIDDPTRIFRGARFATRLGFHFEAQTERYIRAAVDSGIYDITAQANPKTPALQSRLKTELKYLLQVPYWRSTIELLADLGALKCIHSTLRLDSALLWQLRLLERCLRRFDRQQSLAQPPATGLVRWQLRLEAIIAHLAPEYREQVAKNLQLSVDTIDRLARLDRAEAETRSVLPTFQRVSQVVRYFQQFDRQMLVLIAVRLGRDSIRRQIWQYLTIWSHVKPILNGDDLRRLGYKPGAQYRKMLDELLDATLDGVVSDKASAEEFLLSWTVKLT